MPAPASGTADFSFTTEQNEPFRDADDTGYGAAATRFERDGNLYRLVFGSSETVSFTVSPPGHIHCTFGIADISELSAFLMGPAITCLLRVRGELVLHGCVVRVGDRAAAILGASGRGKSTLAAAFAARGHALLADDILVPRREGTGWRAWPGSPAIKLWPGSLASLGDRAPASAPMFRSLDKRVAALSLDRDTGPWRFQPEPLPLAAIYVLEPREAGLSAPRFASIEPLTAVRRLMANRSLMAFTELDADFGAREFGGLAALVRDVPARSLACPDGLNQLDDTVAAIVDDLAAL